MRKVFLFFALFVVFVQTKAQVVYDAYKAEVAKIIRLQRLDRMYSETIRAQMKIQVDQGKIPPEKLDLLTTDLTKFAMPLIVKKMLKLYRQYYTIEELKQINAFLASPVGQKNVRLTPLFAEEMTKLMSSEPVKNKVTILVQRRMTQ